MQEKLDTQGNSSKELRFSLWNMYTENRKKCKVSKIYFLYHHHISIQLREWPKNCIKSTKSLIPRTMKWQIFSVWFPEYSGYTDIQSVIDQNELHQMHEVFLDTTGTNLIALAFIISYYFVNTSQHVLNSVQSSGSTVNSSENELMRTVCISKDESF